MSSKDLMTIPDEVLVEQYISGNQDAFQKLYERYKLKLYDYALRYLREPDLAEDVTQEALLSMYCNISQFNSEKGTLKTWLFSIVHHECYRLQHRYLNRYFRLHWKEQSTEELILSEEGWNQTAGIDIDRLLQKLPEKYRLPIVLTKIHQLSINESAQILGLSAANVKQRVFRGIQLLRKYLGSEIT